MVFYGNIPLDHYEYTYIRDKILLSNDFVCLDIGANTGDYTDLMASNCAHVYAFEPDSTNFESLRFFVDKHKNVTLFKSAVTKTTGQTTLYKSSVNVGMHRIYETQWYNKMVGTELVDCVSIDEFLLPILHKLDFVKMDIEGSEWGALQAMATTIGIFKPTMIIEFHAPSLDEFESGSPKLIYDFLIKHYGKITLLATSYKSNSHDIEDISFKDLNAITTVYDSRNILVTRP